MESNEIMDAEFERTGDLQISLLLQETIRGAMKESEGSDTGPISGIWVVT